MMVRQFVLTCVAIFTLAACSGGTKLIKHTEPAQVQHALAESTDQHLSATVDWVIVRNGAGAWAKNADWDEYLISVTNVSPESVRITSVVVFDSLGTRIESGRNRKQLVQGSKQSVRRYKTSGLKVKAGMGGAGLVATGAMVGIVGFSAGVGISAGAALGGSTVAGGTLAVVGAMAIAGPAFGVFGIVRTVHNSQVNSEIERRHSELPAAVSAAQMLALDIFFPLAPSPGHIEISYVDAQGEHRLNIDTHEALAGLHLGTGKNATGASR